MCWLGRSWPREVPPGLSSRDSCDPGQHVSATVLEATRLSSPLPATEPRRDALVSGVRTETCGAHGGRIHAGIAEGPGATRGAPHSVVAPPVLFLPGSLGSPTGWAPR
jgi:hypothetical protein